MSKETVAKSIKELHEKKYTIVNEDGIRKAYLDPVVAAKINKRIPAIDAFGHFNTSADDIHYPTFIYLNPSITDEEIQDDMEYLMSFADENNPIAVLYSGSDFIIAEREWGVEVIYNAELGFHDLPSEADNLLWCEVGGDDVHTGKTICIDTSETRDLNKTIELAKKFVEIIKKAVVDPEEYVKQRQSCS